MIRYLGRLLGLLVGLAAGIPGAVFGFLSGWLLDSALAVRRSARRVRQYFSAPDAERDDGRALLLGIAGIAHALLSADGPPRRSQVTTFLESPWPPLAGRRGYGKRRRMDTYHLVMREAGPIQYQAVAASIAKRLDPPERDELVAHLASVAVSDGRGISTNERYTLRQIGTAMGVSEATLHAIERMAGDLDPQACLILGVEPSATLETIRSAYRRLASHLHPDTGHVLEEDHQAQMAEAFHRVKTAYETLLRQVREREGS